MESLSLHIQEIAHHRAIKLIFNINSILNIEPYGPHILLKKPPLH